MGESAKIDLSVETKRALIKIIAPLPLSTVFSTLSQVNIAI